MCLRIRFVHASQILRFSAIRPAAMRAFAFLKSFLRCLNPFLPEAARPRSLWPRAFLDFNVKLNLRLVLPPVPICLETRPAAPTRAFPFQPSTRNQPSYTGFFSIQPCTDRCGLSFVDSIGKIG